MIGDCPASDRAVVVGYAIWCATLYWELWRNVGFKKVGSFQMLPLSKPFCNSCAPPSSTPNIFSLHIYSSIKPTLHTPLLIVAPPMWTLADKENLTKFSFERLQVPALSIISEDVANCIAFATPKAIVTRVGSSVTTVTVVADFVQEHSSVSAAPVGFDCLQASLCEGMLTFYIYETCFLIIC